MKQLLAALSFLLFFASPAFAQQPPMPTADPPAVEASVATRTEWCRTYVAWFVSVRPTPQIEVPDDQRSTQPVEAEENYCRLDPVVYKIQTLLELPQEVREEALRER